jgi:hypothetical protein
MTARAAGGVVGGVVGGALAGAATGPGYGELPDFGRVGYLAVTADEIALVKSKTGLFKMKVGNEVLTRAPRSELASTELDRGALKSRLTLRFADGASWEFDVPKANHGTITRVVNALGGTFS